MPSGAGCFRTARYDDIRLLIYNFRREMMQLLSAAAICGMFDLDVLAFDVAGLLQALSDAGQPHDIGLG